MSHPAWLEDIAKALGNAKRTSNGWDAPCPCHDDKTASLSLSVGKTGKLVAHCHAGCTHGDVIAALKSQNLWPKAEEQPAARRIVATYDYLDEAGAPAFQVVRYQPKDFRQRRQPRAGDEPGKIHGGWYWGIKGARQVPYRLPQVVAAIAAGQLVLVVEGEKDADALAKLGLTATCNAGGASKSQEKCKWRREHTACLRSADAVIIPDNDEAGRRHGNGVAASLNGVAKRVRWLDLPGLPEKGDVSDWLAAGHTVEELKTLIADAPGWSDPPTVPAAAPSPAADWRARLIKAPNGHAKPLLANAALALREAPEWHGVLALNQLKLTIELIAPPPWTARNGTWAARGWTDNDDARAAEWLQRAGIEVGHTLTHVAVAEVAEHNAYHPVRQYLDGLAWDGIERIQHFATETLGADDIPFVQAASSAMLIAAVARAMMPGCKVDNIPVLEGPQGQLKSTAVERLFGREWFTDDLAEIGSKEAASQIGKTWCAEIAELASMRRADIERVKAFASRRIDSFRPPYGRALVDAPRQSVMWGTTNQSEWLKDETGGRRFWPIACGHIDIKRLERERDQLWAEATHWWRRGEPWWLTDRATIELAREAQESRQVADAWDERITDYLRSKDEVSVGEVLQFGLVISPDKWTPSDQNRVGRFLRHKGWRRRKVGPRGAQKWRYFIENSPVDQMELGYAE